MKIEDVKAIDSHAHFGRYGSMGSQSGIIPRLFSGSLQTVLGRAEKAGIELSIVCSYEAMMEDELPNSLVEINEKTAEAVAEEKKAMQWIYLYPTKRVLEYAKELLKRPKSFGLKIHSELGYYNIEEYGDLLFSFAAEQHTIIAVNSGAKDTRPEIYSTFANRYPEMTMILTYLGRRWDSSAPDFQTTAILKSKHNNIYADTAGVSAIRGGVIEWAVREVGAAYIVFGSDNPNYFAPSQRIRIEKAEISERAKCLILRENIARLIGLERRRDDVQARRD